MSTSWPTALLPDGSSPVVVAQTIKGGWGPFDGEPITGSLLVLLVILVALVTLLFWASTLTAARRSRGDAFPRASSLRRSAGGPDG